MPDIQHPTAEQEIAELRRQVLELREGQEQLKHKDGAGDKNDQKEDGKEKVQRKKYHPVIK